MQSLIFVPFEFLCPTHQKQISHLNLTQNHPKEKRILCNRCDFDNQQNLKYIGHVFEFLNHQQEKSSKIAQEISTMHENFTKAKLEIINFLDLVEKQITSLQSKIEANKLIKDDFVKKYLQKQNKYPAQELTQLAATLSENVYLNDGKIILKKDFFTQVEQELQAQTHLKINYLLEICTKFSEFSDVNNKQQPIAPHPQSSIILQKPIELFEYQKVGEVSLAHEVYIMQFNRIGQLLAIGGKLNKENCYLSVWMISDSKQLSVFQNIKGHKREVKAISFSSIDDSFVTGSIDCTMMYWKQQSQQYNWVCVQQLTGHDLAINCIMINRLQTCIASSSQQIILWNKDITQNNEWIKKFEYNDHETAVTSLSFNEEGNLLVSGSLDCKIVVFASLGGDWQPKQELEALGQPIQNVFFVGPCDFISIQLNNTITFWNVDQNEQDKPKTQQENLQIVQSAYCSKKKLLSFSTNANTKLFQVQSDSSKKLVQELPIKSLQCQFSLDANRLAAISDGKIVLFQEQKEQGKK